MERLPRAVVLIKSSRHRPVETLPGLPDDSNHVSSPDIMPAARTPAKQRGSPIILPVEKSRPSGDLRRSTPARVRNPTPFPGGKGAREALQHLLRI